MSDSPVIDYLAERFADLGFSCEIVACSQPGKVNLIATKGTGPEASCSPGTPIPCLLIRHINPMSICRSIYWNRPSAFFKSLFSNTALQDKPHV